MNSTICAQCRQALRQRLRAPSSLFTQSAKRTNGIISTARPLLAQRRQNHSNSQSANNDSDPDIRSLLSNPTWSVRSLLPQHSLTSETTTKDNEITSKTLHHLLRLSALPPPATPEEEDALLTTLRTQLHFVRSIQGVDTAGVAPLAAIRDETARGRREQTIGLEALKEALANEDVVGHSRRPRRRRVEQDQQQMKKEGQRNEAEDWDALAGASETAGRYFVVRSGKGGEAQ
ncbi:hypothetical protein PG985_008363 [Apiospora marii]|uniref:Glutamyl-tRNA amidotransferase complex subunit Gta3 domain-containing protein n=1 Tax=Apiospora marii TaxID=335849 RepID=A0ABR1SRR7_9PEZI